MIRMLPFDFGEQNAFCLYEDEKLLSKCLYDLETGEIFRIVIKDEAGRPLNVALLKAVLSRMEYAGVEEAWSVNPELFRLLKVMRFRQNGEKVSVPLKGYFDNACECGGKQN